MKLKRFLAAFMTAVITVSTFVFTSNSATLVFSDGFDEGFLPANWLSYWEVNHFQLNSEGGSLIGYADAAVLQSNYENGGKQWSDGYRCIDFRIRAFDDIIGEEPRSHRVSLWYRDLFETQTNDGKADPGPVYYYEINIDTGKAVLKKQHTWKYTDEYGEEKDVSINNVIAEGQLPYEITTGIDAPFYNIGMMISQGKIECYFDGELIITAEADSNDSKYGDFTKNSVDETVGIQKSPFVFFNYNNYIELDNFEVWSEVPIIIRGDVNGDGKVNLYDVSLILKYIDGWNVSVSPFTADVTDDGNIDLTDVSMILKYIAKWDGIVLG